MSLSVQTSVNIAYDIASDMVFLGPGRYVYLNGTSRFVTLIPYLLIKQLSPNVYPEKKFLRYASVFTVHALAIGLFVAGTSAVFGTVTAGACVLAIGLASQHAFTAITGTTPRDILAGATNHYILPSEQYWTGKRDNADFNE